MSEIITYVGIDAHKRDLHVAMLVGAAVAPVTWVVENEPKAIARLHRTLEREALGRALVCLAVARELTGFIWAALQPEAA